MSPSKEQQTAAAVIILINAVKKKEKKKRCWVKDWVKKRKEFGAGNQLLKQFEIEDSQQFFNFTRMGVSQFEKLLSLIGPAITKKDTSMRKAISGKERLLVTLRFLATGDSYASLQYLFRIPACTISIIVKEVSTALYENLKEVYLKMPSTPSEWLRQAEEFEKLWNFPHCLGAIDGKHIVIQSPKNSGSVFYNYKGSHSIVLMAVADAHYKFSYIDVGCNGRISDGGVFQNCSLYKGLENQIIKLPDGVPLPGRVQPMPYVFVADDAFAMKSYILKPFPFRDQPAPNRIFNYRLSRARRIVENAFGILANRFRVLRKPLLLQPETAEKIVLAICTLHNYILSFREARDKYIDSKIIDTEDKNNHNVQLGSWHQDENAFIPLQQGIRHNYTISQKNVREEFKEFFMTPSGEVSWQYNHIA